MGGAKTTLMIVGALLILLGIAGLVIPTFNTQQTNDVAKVGDLKLQAQETTPHTIPEPVSIGALVLGVVLIGAGVARRA